MKKLVSFTAFAVLSITNTSLATTSFNVTDFITPQLPDHYKAEKANMDSGCQLRNPFNDNCTVFWTQHNEYLITRGEVYNQARNEKAGNAVIPVACRIVRHKRDGSTNPDSTSSGYKTGEENYAANYNVKFTWFVNTNPISETKNFYIHNNEITSEFIAGSRDNNTLADEFCNKEITAKLLSLEGTEIQEELTLTR